MDLRNSASSFVWQASYSLLEKLPGLLEGDASDGIWAQAGAICAVRNAIALTTEMLRLAEINSSHSLIIMS
ncbi:MAG: hypothetical protein KKB37_15205 [Alphaproteobacteria bacterium]|nr:hypothetical protein [Alphaproteobacteria bacterium]